MDMLEEVVPEQAGPKPRDVGRLQEWLGALLPFEPGERVP